MNLKKQTQSGKQYGEPTTLKEGATETFAELQFVVTEMIQA
jgi:hypothetical protein